MRHGCVPVRLLAALTVAAALCLGAASVRAQWIYRAPNVPRTSTGAADLAARPPRTAWGAIDLSGLWQTDIKFNANLAADLRPGDVPMLPAAQALYAGRQDNLGKDDPEGYCMPPGFPRVNGVPFPTKIVQTPTLVVMLYETRTMFRQIFLDSHALAKDPLWRGECMTNPGSHKGIFR
jgi:hypothetical protein